MDIVELSCGVMKIAPSTLTKLMPHGCKRFLSCLSIFLCVSILQASISVSVPEKCVTVRQVEGNAQFTGNKLYGEPGCPLLPAKRYTFLVPPDVDLSTVSFHIRGLKENVLEGSYKVKPASPPYSINGPVWPDKRNIVDGKDIDIYTDNQYYPKDYIQDVSVGNMRCYKIVRVRVYFSKYNPVSGKLKYLEEGKLVLNVGRKSQLKNTHYSMPAIFRKFAKNITINYDDIAPAYNSAYSFTRKTKYIIITESSIQSGSEVIEDFKDSKEDRGFDVEIITEDDWGGGTGSDAAENIRAWLKSNYEEMGIEYVQLIGSSTPSSGKVPMYGSTPTDFYYQDIDKDWEDMDGFVEVIAARIPVYNNDMTTLDKILQKTIDYENAPQSEIGWRAFCFIAEKPYDSKTPGYPLFEEIKTKFLDPQGWGNYRIYDVSNGDPDESSCTKTAVQNAWEKLKFGLMLWMTHGSATSASDIMSSSTMKTFSDEYPSIVFMGSCSNATITNSGNLTYTALKHACIGAIGGTVMTWYEDEQVDNFEGTSGTQGFLWHYAKGIVVDSLGAGSALAQTVAEGDKRYNLKGYNLFGCPDVGVYSCDEETSIDKIPLNPDKGVGSARLVAVQTNSNTVNFLFAAKCGNVATTLTVNDVSGKEIFRRTEQKYLNESYKLSRLCTWDLKSPNGKGISSGVYIAVFKIKDLTTNRTAVVNNKVCITKR